MLQPRGNVIHGSLRHVTYVVLGSMSSAVNRLNQPPRVRHGGTAYSWLRGYGGIGRSTRWTTHRARVRSQGWSCSLVDISREVHIWNLLAAEAGRRGQP